MTLELRLKEMQTAFVNEVGRLEGVDNAMMVSYSGEFAA